MFKRRWLIEILFGIIMAGLLTGIIFFIWQQNTDTQVKFQPESSSVDLGISYLPLSAETASYYGLPVDSGALVTQVNKNSVLARAGIQEGDIILEFNGVQVSEKTPLLGMMRSCPMGHELSMLILSKGEIHEIAITH